MSGDRYFPAFEHSINSETMPEIAGPLSDTLNANSSFDLEFTAPDADSVSITLLYFGSGIQKQDTSKTVDTFIPDIHNVLIPNSGHYLVPRYVQTDTFNYYTITPNEVLVSIAWAKSDTVHAGSKLYGFVTEVVRTRDYILK